MGYPALKKNEMYGVNADTQVKAYLLDAIGKAKSDKETFDI